MEEVNFVKFNRLVHLVICQNVFRSCTNVLCRCSQREPNYKVQLDSFVHELALFQEIAKHIFQSRHGDSCKVSPISLCNLTVQVDLCVKVGGQFGDLENTEGEWE